MIQSPACVDALEARLATNVSHHAGAIPLHGLWSIGHVVSAKGFSFEGKGRSPEAAVRDFLIRNNLSD